MIEIQGVQKWFRDIEAIQDISAEIREGMVFGLVGTNGAGKSTLLRILAGVLKADAGAVLIDGEPVYENEEIKKKVFFIPDEQHYFANESAKGMMEYYAMIYKDFDREKFATSIRRFGMDMDRKLSTFSKGMKRQVSVLLGICANTKYLLCDETFDGLDPVMRQAVKGILADEIMNRDFTPIIASHNLRELEDICDHVGLLHKGGILFSRDLEDMKCNIHKIQCVFKEQDTELELLRELQVLKSVRAGSLLTITVRGNREEIVRKTETKAPLFYEVLPLTLEEIFISETEVAGYDIKNFFL